MACSQLSSRAVFQSKKDLWSLLFRYAICKAALAAWRLFSTLLTSQSRFRIPDCEIIHPLLTSLSLPPFCYRIVGKQAWGCLLCHWKRRPPRLSGVGSIIHREESTPESQVGLARSVGLQKKIHRISTAMPGDGFCRAREVQVHAEVTFTDTRLFPNDSQRSESVSAVFVCSEGYVTDCQVCITVGTA